MIVIAGGTWPPSRAAANRQRAVVIVSCLNVAAIFGAVEVVTGERDEGFPLLDELEPFGVDATRHGMLWGDEKPDRGGRASGC